MAYGNTKISVSRDKTTEGKLKVGSPALIPFPPLERINERTVSVSTPLKMTNVETTKIAVKAAGIFFVIRGKRNIIAIVAKTNQIITSRELPCNH